MKLPANMTPEELSIVDTIAARMYSKIEDPIDKFIMMAHYEAGYSKTDVAIALGLSIAAVSKRDKKIRTILSAFRRLNSEGDI